MFANYYNDQHEAVRARDGWRSEGYEADLRFVSWPQVRWLLVVSESSEQRIERDLSGARERYPFGPTF